MKGAAVFASRDFFVGFFGLGEGEIAREVMTQRSLGSNCSMRFK